jgi:hypothetical protein
MDITTHIEFGEDCFWEEVIQARTNDADKRNAALPTTLTAGWIAHKSRDIWEVQAGPLSGKAPIDTSMLTFICLLTNRDVSRVEWVVNILELIVVKF